MEVASRYINAIKLIPELNEAKVEYIMWLVSTGKHVVAQEMVHQLNEVPPETVGVVDTSLYGSHVHALRAFVYMQGGGNVTSVLSDLLQALNYPVVSALCHSVDAWVRKKVAFDRIGIVYAQTDLYEIGKAVASKLERSDVFSNVAVFVNPLAANYANGVYFHIGDQSTWYKEETDPYTTKVLISPEQPDGTMAFGWDYTFVVDPQGTDFSAFIEEVYEHVFGQWATVPASTLQDGLDLMKMVTEQYVAVHHSDQTVSPEEWKRITDILTNHPNDIVAINECPSSGFVGKRELLLKHGVRLPNIYDWVIHTEADAQEFTNEAVPPNPKFPQKRVYIYAEGVEPWDGTTPYRVGIGASEASVVYLAEELAKMHKVYVFSPTTYVHEIDGVTYIPNTEFGSYPCPDVLISSRCPHILIKRYAPVQLLWLHDLYEHTAFPEECVFDKLICVSPGEQRKAENDWGYKAIVIPNPYKPNTTPHNPVYGRCIWLSSPDRGIANLLRSEIATQDLWLTYSYFNARVMRAHDPIQFRRIWEEKYKLRTAGVKLVGRLGLYELRRLLSTCDIWPYASTFKETFCVAALEAIGAGLYPIYSCAGATMGTVQRYTSSVWHDLDDADEVLDELENIQDYDYRQGCNREISPAVFPENVCIQWLRIIQ
jgi:hypothetical protein